MCEILNETVEQEKSLLTPVFSQRCAGYLMLKGFVLVCMQPSEFDNRRNVFYFKDTEILAKTIHEFKLKKNAIDFFVNATFETNK